MQLCGRVYLFETLALNVYFALSLGLMRFTEQKTSRTVEQLAHIAGSYYAGHSTDAQRQQMITAYETYAKDSTEVGELARSYISMVQDLGGYVENLRTALAEKKRINAELNLASNIQAHVLPSIFRPFRSTALFMVIAKTLLKNHTQMGMQLKEVFETVNRLLCDGNDAGLFLTAWMGVLELSGGTMTYVNAGHNPPLLKRADGLFEYLRERTGFVLAGMEDTSYRQNTISIRPGDRLLLYTDGVTEAMTPLQELYGEDRLRTFMNSHADSPAATVLRVLRKDIDVFAGSAPQFDDSTMLLLDFRGREVAMTRRTFPAVEKAVTDVLSFVEAELGKADCPVKTQTAICVAIEELVVNIAHYAYPGGTGSAELAIGIDRDSRIATFVISDTGVPFNPLEKQDPDITRAAEEREIGGLGIFIVKKTMDTVSYARVGGENRLTMKKKL